MKFKKRRRPHTSFTISYHIYNITQDIDLTSRLKHYHRPKKKHILKFTKRNITMFSVNKSYCNLKEHLSENFKMTCTVL